jgi:hypothetical protein
MLVAHFQPSHKEAMISVADEEASPLGALGQLVSGSLPQGETCHYRCCLSLQQGL